MLFAEALKKLQLKEAEGMRLPKWKEDVVIRVQFPDEHSKMTHPYLYVESRFGCVPWKETVPEMFDNTWELVGEADKNPELKDQIFNCLTWYANKVEETVAYDTWSDEYCRKKIKEYNDILMVNLKKLIDWDNLTADVMKMLRFQIWTSKEEIAEDAKEIMDSKELTNEEKITKFEKLKNSVGIRLIPLYLVSILPVGIELISIFGDKIIYDGKNIDLDNRFGCIGYGLNPKEEKNA